MSEEKSMTAEVDPLIELKRIRMMLNVLLDSFEKGGFVVTDDKLPKGVVCHLGNYTIVKGYPSPRIVELEAALREAREYASEDPCMCQAGFKCWSCALTARIDALIGGAK